MSPHHRTRLVRFVVPGEEFPEALEPLELVGKLRALPLGPLGDVGVHDVDPRKDGPDQAVLVGGTSVVEAEGHHVGLLRGDDGHPVVAFSPAVGHVPPCILELLRRELGVLRLGLLEAENRGTVFLEPGKHDGKTDAHRVDVVRGDLEGLHGPLLGGHAVPRVPQILAYQEERILLKPLMLPLP